MARASTRSQRIVAPTGGGRVGPVTFLRETYVELQKSTWPSREETSRLTVVVIVLAIVAGFFLGGLDRIFAELFARVIF
ncbi:MAG: preprotein translocase subunit SecE [Chloroflexi bacterium]|nr:preprotein translocase subunit SecE [Chloroflexota bacterium]MCH9018424.1 preprotein translocase subunit SecE [Chloroflexota bacterium]MCI0788659.1 preprotein translocase subunit SecE [Chloroflexota bacterium]MCI0801285.1 preprotein translocase subunit SecE [Chloroflexota bacterium]MCI0810605.1 preprotein translocase subunit SecE [Chloroflexota bacterium]